LQRNQAPSLVRNEYISLERVLVSLGFGCN
jgi:hypothetical protein